MIHDIHSHTHYSMCGRDDPHRLCEAAIRDGIDILGISDHNYGIRAERFARYRADISALREEYAGKLKILCGIEICTLPCWTNPPRADWSIGDTDTLEDFDYCLVEHLDLPGSLMQGDLLSFAAKRRTRVGIAHTDLFSFCAARSLDPLDYLSSLARANVFWEMNVNYDSIHGFREHAYVLEFRRNPEQQEIVRKSGIRLSVGFDGHRAEEYDGKRVISMHRFLAEHELPIIQPENW